MKITVVGTGYVGLVSGTRLAEAGNDVLRPDIGPERIRILQKGRFPVYEPSSTDAIFRIPGSRADSASNIFRSAAK